MKIKARKFVAVLYFINFLMVLAAVGFVLQKFWKFLEDWEVALYLYYLLLGVCGVAIAYWIVKDEEDIKKLERRILELERKTKSG